jgi:hypothetical protein
LHPKCGFISVLSQFSLDSAEGGQRIEIAKYKKIENSKFLSDRHPFNIPSLLVGTVGLTLRLNFEEWLNSQGSGFQLRPAELTDRRRGTVGDAHSANSTVKKVKVLHVQTFSHMRPLATPYRLSDIYMDRSYEGP